MGCAPFVTPVPCSRCDSAASGRSMSFNGCAARVDAARTQETRFIGLRRVVCLAGGSERNVRVFPQAWCFTGRRYASCDKRSRRAVYHPFSRHFLSLRRFGTSASRQSSREPRKSPAGRGARWCRPAANLSAPHRTKSTDAVAVGDAVTAECRWQPMDHVALESDTGAPTTPRSAPQSDFASCTFAHPTAHRQRLSSTPPTPGDAVTDMKWVDCHIRCRPLGRQWPWWPLVRFYILHRQDWLWARPKKHACILQAGPATLTLSRTPSAHGQLCGGERTVGGFAWRGGAGVSGRVLGAVHTPSSYPRATWSMPAICAQL